MKEKSEKVKESERFINHRDRRIQELKQRKRDHKRMVIGAPGKNEESK